LAGNFQSDRNQLVGNIVIVVGGFCV